MPNKEHKIAEQKRDIKDKKATTIVFSVMAVSFVACAIYIIIYA